MHRCVIVGGAAIEDYEYIKSRLQDDDFFIYCDCGLKHMEKLDRRPNLIIGDFDSHEDPHMDIETIVLPVKKDDTDTFYAVKEAVKRGFEEFLLIGAIGNRLDHTLGNISILLMLNTRKLKAGAIDDYSEFEIISDNTAYVEDSYPFFSIVNITGLCSDITIKNAKFPLEHGNIDVDYQYGVSNEVLPGKTAEITIGKGRALLIKDRR